MNRTPMLALADPTHRAIAWSTDEFAFRVASLRDDGTNLGVGAPHVIPFPAQSITFSGIVHVGDERYVVSWTDAPAVPQQSRLYALVVDLNATIRNQCWDIPPQVPLK